MRISDWSSDGCSSDLVFVSVDPPLVISLIQQGEVTHHVTMQLNLLLADERNLDATNRRMPLLRDAMLTELHSLFALRLVRDAGFESALVKQRLLDICRSEEHTSELQSLMRISYAVFCL